ncbi:low temperature requirement protein A [Peterkaempfera sp. SMS 1(5)a]|uniref:low temperature requirement protein A n=1 Tax=Peterkaempfera podocarpi TaxID=3232308 RepID=UPI0036721962
MTARDPEEETRSTTPLELLFDLCFVVAVAQAGVHLVGALAEGRPGHGLTGYLFVFFAIWWAWVNFSWFASAYDCDDVPYRLATLVQICGVLVLAAGVPRAFEQADYAVAVVGYLIMRLVMTGQWLRAAHGETGPARTTALRFAVGLTAVQVCWVVLLLLPAGAWTPGFLLLVVCELALPAYAEHSHKTPWHPQHIAERYGAFTIITLGESVAAATVAVQSAVAETSELDELLPIAAGGLLIVFAAYWIYFAVPIHEHLVSNRQAFLWGYGHYLVFGSAAAIGAGIEVAVEQTVGRARIPAVDAAAALTVPTAVFLLSAWLLHARHFKVDLSQQLVLPVSALLVLACTFAGRHAAPLAGLVAAATVAVGVVLAARTPERHPAR